MAYVSNPVYLGVGSVDKPDRQAAIVNNANFRIRFKNAYTTFMRMPEAQRRLFVMQVNKAVLNLPASQQKQVDGIMKAAAQTLDPRLATGLGDGGIAAAAGATTQAVHWSQTAANIAGVVASIATLGLSTWNFMDQREANKEQAAIQERQQRMAEEQMKAEIAERQQRLDAAKAQTAALEQQQKADTERKQLEASGYTIAPDGQIVKKSNLPAIGIAAAAAAGAFLLT